MATPAFIYAFDNLGPDRFVELCALLIGSRYGGFLVGGPGSDGGVDGELAEFGQLNPDNQQLVGSTLVRRGELTAFQFKHKVVARSGQARARSQLLAEFRSTGTRAGELGGRLLTERKYTNYVLVTNVEVNANWREEFRRVCRAENSDIRNFEVLGLDDLQSWVTQDRNLRAQWFPTIFGRATFNLAVKMQLGTTLTLSGLGDRPGETVWSPSREIVVVDVMNVGEATSYLSNIKFKNLRDGQVGYALPSPLPPGQDPLNNPKLGDPIHPGQSQQFRYFFELFRGIPEGAEEFLLAQVCVWDQIDNMYSLDVPADIRDALYPPAESE